MKPMVRRHLPALIPVVLFVFGLMGCSMKEADTTMTTAKAPQESPSRAMWSLENTPLDRTASQFANFTDERLTWAATLRDRALAAPKPRTIANTLEPINEMWMHLDALTSQAELFSMTHPDAQVRKMAEQAQQRASQFITELWLNRDLYEAYQGVDLTGADPATRYMVDKTLRDFRREGIELDAASRERLIALNNEIVKAGQEFHKAINEDVRFVELESPADLDGLSRDWIDRHVADAGTREDGKIRVTTDYPDYVPFMKYAHNAEARRQLSFEAKNRGFPVNMGHLNDLIQKRYEKARLLGFATWADYITDDYMVGSAENAQAFVDGISRTTLPAAREELKPMLDRKRKDIPDAERIEPWEAAYYMNLVRKEQFDLDNQKVREYFNEPDVLNGLLAVTSDLFDIEYKQVQGLDLWHKDVTAWDVYSDGRRIGRFYLDLFPRENKYKHAAQFDYCRGVSGERLPQATLVCNFPNPAENADGVALMEHSDVVTLFHEFGHLLHYIFAGDRRWVRNSGISTELDFVEAPSQMLEEWAWRYDALKLFAQNPRTGEVIPKDLVEKMHRAKRFGESTRWAVQTFYSSVALAYYTTDPSVLDTTETFKELTARYSPYPYEEGTHFQCSFGHLEGYSAAYYSYVWSKAIACDLFSAFEKNGMFDPDTARRYRDKILAPGGSKKATDLIRDFLDRDYSAAAFEEFLRQAS